jgi:hypothetical protein
MNTEADERGKAFIARESTYVTQIDKLQSATGIAAWHGRNS